MPTKFLIRFKYLNNETFDLVFIFKKSNHTSKFYLTITVETSNLTNIKLNEMCKFLFDTNYINIKNHSKIEKYYNFLYYFV